MSILDEFVTLGSLTDPSSRTTIYDTDKLSIAAVTLICRAHGLNKLSLAGTVPAKDDVFMDKDIHDIVLDQSVLAFNEDSVCANDLEEATSELRRGLESTNVTSAYVKQKLKDAAKNWKRLNSMGGGISKYVYADDTELYHLDPYRRLVLSGTTVCVNYIGDAPYELVADTHAQLLDNRRIPYTRIDITDKRRDCLSTFKPTYDESKLNICSLETGDSEKDFENEKGAWVYICKTYLPIRTRSYYTTSEPTFSKPHGSRNSWTLQKTGKPDHRWSWVLLSREVLDALVMNNQQDLRTIIQVYTQAFGFEVALNVLNRTIATNWDRPSGAYTYAMKPDGGGAVVFKADTTACLLTLEFPDTWWLRYDGTLSGPIENGWIKNYQGSMRREEN